MVAVVRRADIENGKRSESETSEVLSVGARNGGEQSSDSLESRIRAARARTKAPDPATAVAAGGGGRGVAFALRVGTELAAALAVAVGLGIALDRWLGTAPWALVLLFPLGAAAGVLNVWRLVDGVAPGIGSFGVRRQSRIDATTTDVIRKSEG